MLNNRLRRIEVLLGKLMVSQLLNQLPAFYKPPVFNTKIHHRRLFRACPLHPIPILVFCFMKIRLNSPPQTLISHQRFLLPRIFDESPSFLVFAGHVTRPALLMLARLRHIFSFFNVGM